MFVSQAFADNQEGVEYMSQGNYHQAIQCFLGGLKRCSASIRDTGSTDEIRKDTNTLDRIMSQNERCPLNDGVYSQPISLPIAVGRDEDTAWSILPKVLLFNQAVAHTMATGSPDASTDVLQQRAIYLYELALALECQNGTATSSRLLLACYNNMGHLHRNLGDIERANQSFEALFGTLMAVTQQDDSSAKEFACYIESTFYLLCPGTDLAAAA